MECYDFWFQSTMPKSGQKNVCYVQQSWNGIKLLLNSDRPFSKYLQNLSSVMSIIGQKLS